jgi:tetratricopeptide (TPR) repeat protein
LFNNWGVALGQMGQPLRAAALLRRAIALSSSDGAEASVSPMLLNNFAHVLADLDQVAESSRYAERAYADARRAGDEVVVNMALVMRAEAYRRLNNFAGAEQALIEVQPRLERMLPPGHYAFASVSSERSMLAEARGDFPKAIAAANRAVAMVEAQRQDSSMLPVLLVRRSQLELEMGRADDAKADATRAVRLYTARVAPGMQSDHLGLAYLAVGRALLASGQRDGAHDAFLAALEQLRPTLGRDHLRTRAVEQMASASIATDKK